MCKRVRGSSMSTVLCRIHWPLYHTNDIRIIIIYGKSLRCTVNVGLAKARPNKYGVTGFCNKYSVHVHVLCINYCVNHSVLSHMSLT